MFACVPGLSTFSGSVQCSCSYRASGGHTSFAGGGHAGGGAGGMARPTSVGSTGVPLKPLPEVLQHFCPAPCMPAAGASFDLLAIFTALGGEPIYAALAASRRPPRTRTFLPSGEPRSAANDLCHLASYIDGAPPSQSLTTWDDLAMAWSVEGAVAAVAVEDRIELLIGLGREWQLSEAARPAVSGKMSIAELPLGGFSDMKATLVPSLEDGKAAQRTADTEARRLAVPAGVMASVATAAAIEAELERSLLGGVAPIVLQVREYNVRRRRRTAG